ncbi:hypothetical protein [Bradyrhizobium sp. AS23.2]|nr:hypothetical protein [Bradyrhizobium sp. AS23.2]
MSCANVAPHSRSRLSALTIGPEAITFYRLLLAVGLMSLFVAVSVTRD